MKPSVWNRDNAADKETENEEITISFSDAERGNMDDVAICMAIVNEITDLRDPAGMDSFGILIGGIIRPKTQKVTVRIASNKSSTFVDVIQAWAIKAGVDLATVLTNYHAEKGEK